MMSDLSDLSDLNLTSTQPKERLERLEFWIILSQSNLMLRLKDVPPAVTKSFLLLKKFPKMQATVFWDIENMPVPKGSQTHANLSV